MHKILPDIPIILLKLRRKLLMKIQRIYPYNFAKLCTKRNRSSSFNDFLSIKNSKKIIQNEFEIEEESNEEKKVKLSLNLSFYLV